MYCIVFLTDFFPTFIHTQNTKEYVIIQKFNKRNNFYPILLLKNFCAFLIKKSWTLCYIHVFRSLTLSPTNGLFLFVRLQRLEESLKDEPEEQKSEKRGTTYNIIDLDI